MEIDSPTGTMTPSPTKSTPPQPAAPSGLPVPSKAALPFKEPMREDLLRDVLCASQLAMRKIRARSMIGKVSYEEVTLMLASSIPAIQVAALGILERLAFDATVANIPSGTAMNALLDAVCELYTVEIAEKSCKRPVDHGSLALARPFDVLGRRAEGETIFLAEPISVESHSRIESIVNILRNWATRPDGPAMMAQNARLVWGRLIPSLTRPEIWAQLNVECYTGLWLVAVQVISYVVLADAGKVQQVIAVALDEVGHCLQSQARLSYIMHPTFIFDADNVEAVKKAIIQFIKTSNQFWRQLPRHCFLLMDFLCRILSNVVSGGVFDAEEHGLVRAGRPLAETMGRVLDVMWLCVEQFSMTALGVAFLIDRLLRTEMRQSSEARRYTTRSCTTSNSVSLMADT